MTEKTRKNTLETSDKLVPDFVAVSTDAALVAIAAGVNTLLAVQLKTAADNSDEDVFSVTLAAMAHIVRSFEGEREATKLVDLYTNGGLSKMDGMVEAGLSPEEAAKLATKEDGSVH